MLQMNSIFYQTKAQLCQLFQEHSYSPSTIRAYTRHFNDIEKYLCQEGIDYSPEAGACFLRQYIKEGHLESQCSSLKLTIRRLNDCYLGNGLVFLEKKKSQILPAGFTEVLNLYTAECTEKGNAPVTILKKARKINYFLQSVCSLGYLSIKTLERSVISRACLMVGSKTYWPIIKEFLTFVYEQGFSDKDYSYLVPSFHQASHLPSVYSRDEITKARQMIDVSSPKGKRDLCMFILASQMGIRAGDIVRMKFCNIDLEHNRISFIQQKTKESITHPLLTDFKTAFLDYLNHGRPVSDEKILFLRTLAPYTPLDSSAVSTMVSKYLKKAGIDISNRKHGAHSLRSSLATLMVNDGITYEETRKVLGHRDPSAIKHYAVLDVERLRQCAIEIPEPSGFFKEFLEGRASL